METLSFKNHLINSINNKELEDSFYNKLFFKTEFKDIFGHTLRDHNLLRLFILSRVINKFHISDEHELMRITEAIIKSTKGNTIAINDKITYVISNDKSANTVYSLELTKTDTKLVESLHVLIQMQHILRDKRNNNLLPLVDPDDDIWNKINIRIETLNHIKSKQPSKHDEYYNFLNDVLSFIDKIIVQRFKDNQ